MFIDKLEEVVKEKAEKSYEEDVKKLDELIVKSRLGKVLGYQEGQGIESLGSVDKVELKEEYINKYLEKEVERIVKGMGEELNKEDKEEDIFYEGDFDRDWVDNIEEFEFDFSEGEQSKFEKIVDILKGRD